MAHLRIGDTAPNFDAQTTEGNINFTIGKVITGSFILTSGRLYPSCTHRVRMHGIIGDEFKKRHVKPIALSVDSVEDHKAWAGDISET